MRPVNLHLEGIHLEDITGVGAEDLYLGLIMGMALITDSGLIMDMAHITDLDRIMGTGRIAEAWAQDEDFITEAGGAGRGSLSGMGRGRGSHMGGPLMSGG